MSTQTIARSFAEQLRDCAVELGLDLDAGDAAPLTSEGSTTDPEPSPPDAVPDGDDALAGLAGVLAELEAAGATLATVARQDRAAREHALEQLASCDALAASCAEAERAADAAGEVRRQAEALAAEAFADEARAAAAEVAARAAEAEERAGRCAAARRAALDALARAHGLERLLAARRREQEAEKARAAQAARAARLAGHLAGAGQALAAGRLEEAERLLGLAANEDPGNSEVASLGQMIARERLERKVERAEEVLWTAQRERKRDPEGAAAGLAALDVEGLPEPLARRVFGCWADACRRLCRRRGLLDPLRFAPRLGRGAVLAREAPGGPFVVVSALGMGPRWQPGAPAPVPVARGARPLG